MAAACSAATAARSGEPTGGSSPAATSARQPPRLVGAPGGADGAIPPTSAKPDALARSTAAANATTGPLATGAA
jgi:hypothetical protein